MNSIIKKFKWLEPKPEVAATSGIIAVKKLHRVELIGRDKVIFLSPEDVDQILKTNQNFESVKPYSLIFLGSLINRREKEPIPENLRINSSDYETDWALKADAETNLNISHVRQIDKNALPRYIYGKIL